jgi:hypothetical protein
MEPFSIRGITASPASAEALSFVERTCLPFLRENQGEDGGWGFHAGRQSRVEPTAWALLALEGRGAPQATQDAIERGLRFLAGAQLENGGWAAASGERQGCWVTSLACWALQSYAEYAENSARGLRWLNEDRPGDSGFWWRMVRKLTERSEVNAQNVSLSGWSWTPGTASWVEPTACAMIVHRRQGPDAVAAISARYERAVEMLYDRMCPGGGWNCGNPMVYGVAGRPQIGPTVWALIALRENSHRAENRQSLGWLEQNQGVLKSPESLALSHLGLGVYGRANPALAESIFDSHSAAFPWSISATAWATLALSETSQWLKGVPIGHSRL